MFRWDLDKTYLKSEFETLRELVRIPFEKAADKVAAPGVAALIRGLRESALGRGCEVRTYFLSASPPQIGRAIKEKLELDGILHDGIVFKDQLQRLMRGKFRHLREQVGYKLTELLKARRGEPPDAREWLFGDDWESDPLIYSLYADLIAGRVAPGELGALLRALRVDPPLIAEAVAMAADLTHREGVARIFINLERRTPPAALRVYGPRLVPAFNYFQTAACLYADDVLSASALVGVARALLEESSYTPARLSNSLSDIERRGHIRPATAAAVRAALREAGLLAARRPRRPAERWRSWWERLRRPVPAELAAAPGLIDYRALVGMAEAAEAASE